MHLSHVIISLLPLAFTASALPISSQPSLPGDYNNPEEKDTKMRKLEWVHKESDHPVTEPSLSGPINRFSGAAKSDSHQQDFSEDENYQVDATQEDLGQDATTQENTPQENTPRENTPREDVSPEMQNSASSPQIERRGSDNVDRRQKDRDAPIDFSLMTPCMANCFWKFRGHAPGSLETTSIKDWCEDKAARWAWWMDYGPLQCVVGCKKEDPDTAKISRNWFLSNCGY